MTIRSGRLIRATNPRANHFEERPAKIHPLVAPPPSTPQSNGSMKGFGFVELGDGSGDAFLHIGVLQNSGHDAWLRLPSSASRSVRARRVAR